MWERVIPIAEIEKALDLQGIKDISIDSYTESMRTRYFRMVFESGDRAVLAVEFRKALGWDRLPSTMITGITRQNGSVVFEGRGFGHGVGMCQWSCLQMAKEGKTYREILSHFYPNTLIRKYEDR
jgi:stage II sporulation protein D